MARITLGAERFGTEASRPEYRGLEAGDILYFPVSPPLLPDEDRAFLVTQKQVERLVSQEHQLPAAGGPIERGRPGRLRPTGTCPRDHAWLLATCHRIHVDIFEPVCGELEDRLREFSADRGIGP